MKLSSRKYSTSNSSISHRIKSFVRTNIITLIILLVFLSCCCGSLSDTTSDKNVKEMVKQWHKLIGASRVLDNFDSLPFFLFGILAGLVALLVTLYIKSLPNWKLSLVIGVIDGIIGVIIGVNLIIQVYRTRTLLGVLDGCDDHETFIVIYGNNSSVVALHTNICNSKVGDWLPALIGDVGATLAIFALCIDVFIHAWKLRKEYGNVYNLLKGTDFDQTTNITHGDTLNKQDNMHSVNVQEGRQIFPKEDEQEVDV